MYIHTDKQNEHMRQQLEQQARRGGNNTQTEGSSLSHTQANTVDTQYKQQKRDRNI